MTSDARPGDVPRDRPGEPGYAAAAVALVLGAVTLVVEFAVVRVAAPWFGQGTHVWANTVALVLFALALGYAMGGRLADRGTGRAALVSLLAAGGLWLALAAIFGPRVAAWLAPAAIGADRPQPLSLFGSLAGTAILAGPPLLAIGAMSPVLVVVASARVGAARAAGIVSAAGTLGGLLGCAATPIALVPALGSRGTLLLGAAGLALCALVVALHRAFALRSVVSRRPTIERAEVGPGRLALAIASALICGTVLTLLEFAIVRRLAPVYGSDNRTWATVIGTVLLMSALGATLASPIRRAMRAAPFRMMLVVVLATAPTWYPYARVAGGPVAASLGTGTLVLLLSVVPPLLVGAISRHGRVGRGVSFVFGASTLGNVAGCYLAPLVLLPTIGTRATFLVGGALAVLGFAAARFVGLPIDGAPAARDRSESEDRVASGDRGRVAATVIAALSIAGVGVSSGFIGGPLRRDPGQLEEIETAYSTIRVSERLEPGPTPGAAPLLYEMATYRGRYLGFDEDTTSYQSVRLMDDEDTALTGARYYEHLALGAWFQGQPWASADGGAPRVLVIGYCGGTLHRILAATAPAGRAPIVTGIEIDPDVVALSRRHFGPLPANLELLEGVDGRAALAALPPERKFDLILVDAYQRTQYVPFHLSTVEFFTECARRLAPNGCLGINADSEAGASGKLVRCLAATVAAAFGRDAWMVPNPFFPGNVAIWGSNAARAPRLASSLDRRLELAGFCLDRFLVKYVDGGNAFVLTDDRSPTEALADGALLAVEEVR